MSELESAVGEGQVSTMAPASFWLGSLQNQEGLAGRGSKSAMVMTLGQVARLVFNFGTTLLVVRLLAPSDFGLVAMAATVTNFLLVFKDLGLTTATTQMKDINQAQVSSLFWINVFVGGALALLTVAAAPLVANFYHAPRLTPLIMVLGSGFLLSGIGAQHDALLRRHLLFNKVAIVDITSVGVSCLSSVVFAWIGFGFWALALQRTLQMGIYAAGCWILCDWRPSASLRWKGVRDQLRFGAHVSSFNITNYFSRNADNVLIGWYWGPTALGLYAKCYDLLMATLSQMGGPLNSVMVPLLGRLNEDADRYRRAYFRVIVPANLSVLPLATIMVVFHDAVIMTLFGKNWMAASPVLMWLGVVACAQINGFGFGWLMISQNRTKQYANWGMLNTVFTVLCFALSLRYGITILAMVYALTGLLLRMPAMLITAGTRGAISTRDLIAHLKLPFLGALFCLIPQYLTRHFVTHFPSWQQLGLGFAATLCLPLGLWLLPDGREIMQSTWQLVASSLSRSKVRT